MFAKNLLNGLTELPSASSFSGLNEDQLELVTSFWKSLARTWIHKGSKGTVSLPYWSNKFNDASLFNQVLMVFADSGLITTVADPLRNWGEASINEEFLLKYASPSELASIRAEHKVSHYLLDNKLSSKVDSVRLNGKSAKTGLVRKGFAKAANTQYHFDITMMIKYREAIIANVTKGMRKVRKTWTELDSSSASFDALSAEIIDWLIANPELYNSGGNTSDSRGRAIKDSLSQVFNPIGYKDARALVTIPEGLRSVATDEGVIAVYLFIAELLGAKVSTVEAKIEFGRQAFYNHSLPTLDLDTDEGRKDLYELMWLERLYNELTAYHLSKDLGIEYRWSVPVEVDASALTK